jgi:hypothetical protein
MLHTQRPARVERVHRTAPADAERPAGSRRYELATVALAGVILADLVCDTADTRRAFAALRRARRASTDTASRIDVVRVHITTYA